MRYDLSKAHPNNPFRQPEFISATEWVEPGYPITGNRWLGFGYGQSRVNTQICHYQGSRYPEWKLSPADVDVIRRLREFNRSSWNSRGYAAYYSFDVPVDGRLWGLRAFDFRNAANADGNQADGNENDWTYSTHNIVQKLAADNSDRTVEPTWDQLETNRWLRWEAREYAIEETSDVSFQVDLLGHRQLEPTGCPGDKFFAAIQAGKLAIPPRTTARPDPPTPAPGDDMSIKVFQPVDCDAEFIAYADSLGNCLQVEWIATAKDQKRRDAYLATGAVEVDREPRNAVGSFANCGLIGPIPVGDTKKVWTTEDFAYGIPKVFL